jgi:hypothetical protein
VALLELLGDERVVFLLRRGVDVILDLGLADVPTLPNVTVVRLPDTETFQNLFDVPSLNSNVLIAALFRRPTTSRSAFAGASFAPAEATGGPPVPREESGGKA